MLFFTKNVLGFLYEWDKIFVLNILLLEEHRHFVLFVSIFVVLLDDA